MTQHTPPPLSALVALAEYREQRANIFQSDGSLTWYVRQHRAELVRTGALSLHAGRWHAVPERFDTFVMDEGKRAAEARQAALARPGTPAAEATT